MLNIVLCDDNAMHNLNMAKRIDKIISEISPDLHNSYFSFSPEDITKYSAQHKLEDNVYFLDIDFDNETNGLDLAKHIRENEATPYII